MRRARALAAGVAALAPVVAGVRAGGPTTASGPTREAVLAGPAPAHAPFAGSRTPSVAAHAPVAAAQARAAAAQPPPVATERVDLAAIVLRETPSLLESEPTGWTSVQPGSDLAGWTRLPWPPDTALGPQQWSVDAATGHLVCDGKGEHEWLRYEPEFTDGAFHVEWRFAPVPGADKYNSGIYARTLPDAAVWHQAQVGLEGGFLFGVTPVHGTAKRVTQQPAARRVRPAGEWNTYELVSRGKTLSLWVNGAVTSEITVEVPRGHFGLEAEGWRIEFRNLKVKPLGAPR